ncbi:hypothetical protein MNV49_005712 [Pseudohyphozyma bogoriensis]|nr:hypothetical protein MNV49_005712 [Pseudohyphozyma bogoriensis]
MLHLPAFITLVLLFTKTSAVPRRDTRSEAWNTGNNGYSCRSFVAPIKASAENIAFTIPTPASQQAMIQEVYIDVQQTPPFDEQISAGTATVSGTWNIYFRYCVPNKGIIKPSLLHTIHGLVATADYWDVIINGNPANSFVRAATAAGYAVLTYDRLGVRNSVKPPDGINTNQLSLQTAISLEINSLIRSNKLRLGRDFSSIVGVGFSFGSVMLLEAASRDPDAFDGLVLTGFTANFTLTPLSSFVTFHHTIAANAGFGGSLPKSYLITGDQSGDQLGFFSYPNYTQAALNAFTQGKGTYTIGELLSVTSAHAAPDYVNPVQIVTGDRDTIFCQTNCFDAPPSANGVALSSKLDTARFVFPNVGNKFSTYVVPYQW